MIKLQGKHDVNIIFIGLQTNTIIKYYDTMKIQGKFNEQSQHLKPKSKEIQIIQANTNNTIQIQGNTRTFQGDTQNTTNTVKIQGQYQNMMKLQGNRMEIYKV